MFFARGGRGCILYPAILFTDDDPERPSVVQPATRRDFVTKVAADACEEYNIAQYVKSKAPDAGVYPVDLSIFVSPTEIDEGVLEQINQNCKDIVDILDDGREWCAIQIPKYDMDVRQMISRPFPCRKFPRMALFLGMNRLAQRLASLHRIHVYHMDIKDTNLAVMTPDASGPYANGPNIKFADWGTITKVFPIYSTEYLTGILSGEKEKSITKRILEHLKYDFPENIAPGLSRYYREYLILYQDTPEFDSLLSECRRLEDDPKDENVLQRLIAALKYMLLVDRSSLLSCIRSVILCGKDIEDRSTGLYYELKKVERRYMRKCKAEFPMVYTGPVFSETDMMNLAELLQNTPDASKYPPLPPSPQRPDS